MAISSNLAWAAGFFEGEGCFYLHKGNLRWNGTQRLRAAASLVQKGKYGKELLEKFRTVIGFGYIHKENRKTGMYKWSTCGYERVKTLFDALKPMLSPRRIETAKRVLDEDKNCIIRPLRPTCPEGHEYTLQNTLYRRDNGSRICRTCRNEQARKWRASQPKGYWKRWPSQKIAENGDI